MTDIHEPPNPIEVNDFKFLQLQKLKVVDDEARMPSDAINLVAVSSRYGLVFVGIGGGFKILKLENILNVNEESNKPNQPTQNYPYQKVYCLSPVSLALSYDDMTLAVCIETEARVVADMYDIRAFAQSDIQPAPFLTVQLSSYATGLKDFMWNPVTVERYAYCLADGSLHVHDVSEMALTIVASLPPQTGATAVCWSPKGKQVVVGKRDGSFSQYKPTLQEAKRILAPNLHPTGTEVLNICWLTTTTFAVVYISRNNPSDNLPNLVLVSTPKGVPVSYTRFGDICLGNDITHKPKYLLHHQPEWNMMVCASANAVETGVVTCLNAEKTYWVQMALEDGGRAEMPIDKYIETFPLGMSFIFCAQRKIAISDTILFPPMPIVFLLSTNGILCPFHVLNFRPGASNLVFPSEAISVEGERKAKGVPQGSVPLQKIGAFGNTTPNVLQSKPTFPTATNVIVTTPAFSFSKDATSTPFSFKTQTAFAPVSIQSSPATSAPGAASFQLGTNTSKAMAPTVSAFGFQPAVKSPTVPSIVPIAVSNKMQRNSVSDVSQNVMFPTSSPLKVAAKDVSPVPIATDTTPGRDVPKDNISSIPVQEDYSSQIMAEIKKFNGEIEYLKRLASNLKINIGSTEEKAAIKKQILTIGDHNSMVKEIESMSLDIHSLKTASLESLSFLGEANSRKFQRNDPRHVSLLRDRPLDALSAKRMRKVQQLQQYLGVQLQEVRDKLDLESGDHQNGPKKQTGKKVRLSSSQAIYQTVVNNQSVIHNLADCLSDLTLNLSYIKDTSVSKNRRFPVNVTSLDGELEVLADALIDPKFHASLKPSSHPAKKLSSKFQSSLREAFSNHHVTCVRPKPIGDMSESQLLSSTILHPDLQRYPMAGKEELKVMNTAPVMSPIQSASATVSKISNMPSTSEAKPVSAFTMKSPATVVVGGIMQGVPIVRPTLHSSVAANSVGTPTEGLVKSPVVLEKPSSAFKALSPSTSSEEPKSMLTQMSSFFQAPPKASMAEPLSPFNAQQNIGTSLPSSNPHVASAGLFKIKVPTVPVATTFKPTLIESAEPSSKIIAEAPIYEDITPPLSPYPTADDFPPEAAISSRPIRVTALHPQLDIPFASQPSGEVFVISTADGSVTVQKSNMVEKNNTKEPNVAKSMTLSAFSDNSGLNVQNVQIEQKRDPSFTPNTTFGQLQTKKPEEMKSGVNLQIPGSKAEITFSQNASAFSVAQPVTTTTTTKSPSFGFPSSIAVSTIPSPTPSSTIATSPLSSQSVVTSTTVAASTAPATSTTSSFFGNVPALSSTANTTVLGQTAPSVFFSQTTPTTTQSSFFKGFSQSPPTSTTVSVFGQPTTTTTSASVSSPFGQATTTAATSPFGQPVTTAATPFGQVTPTTTTAASPFGQVPTTSVATSPFGQPVITTAASPFGQAATTTTTSPFGQQPASPFGQSTAQQFGQQTTSPFGQQPTSPGGVFNQSNNAASPFGQTFFSQSPTADGSSMFGQKEQTQSMFGGGGSSGFSFKPAFGQQSPNTFGLANAVFGQSPPQSNIGFGQTGEQPVFGQTGFFSGLGSKPNEQNANKNAFGTNNFAAGGSATSLFGNQGATAFGVKSGPFSAGSFSIGGSSVAQTGFGAFQQQTPQKSAGGFGGAATFGGGPAFGGSPTFGSQPVFGGGLSPNLSSSFGSAQNTFSNFATADAPSFGALAQSGGGFNAMQQQQQQQQQQNQGFGQQNQGSVFGGGSLFGGSAASPPSFGGSAASPPSFGAPAGSPSTFGGQQSGFGSPSGGGTSAFSQWRS